MSRLKVKSIAIIGAGPAGLAAAKSFMAEKAFDRIVVYEQRNKVGGVWVHTPENNPAIDDAFGIPQTSPFARVDSPIRRYLHRDRSARMNGQTNGAGGNDEWEPVFPSPMYDALETNIPHMLMQFSDKDFPNETQLFPRHDTVLKYLEEYARDVNHLIQFETQVTGLSLLSTEPDKWTVQTRRLKSEDVQSEHFDAVAIANGHYNIPYIPDIQGLKEWNTAFPNSISHSKYYRRPEEFRDKKVIVVGNSASGIDIGSQIANVCKTPLIVSSKSESYLTPATPLSNNVDRPQIASFDVPNAAVTFANGHTETGVDCVVFCTGYFYSYPFLDTKIQRHVISDGTRVARTYLHLLYQDHPTLSFLALPQKVIPFPISEAQSAVLARLYSGRLGLPSLESMQNWESRLIQEHGDRDEFHVLQFPKDANYINQLHDWAQNANLRDGLANGGQGKPSPYWGEWARWCRPKFPDIRKAFGAKGEQRHEIYGLDQIGFHFEVDDFQQSSGRNEPL